MAKLHRGARRRVPGPARTVRGAALVAATALVVAPLTATPTAFANTAGTGLVISEVYGGGGNSNATYNHDFVELYNPTSAAIDVSNMSVQYQSATGTGTPGATPLTGSVPAGGYYLVAEAGGSTGVDLPTAGTTGSLNLSGSNGTVFLANQQAALPERLTSPVDNAAVLDLVGYGTTNAYEGTPASSPGGNTESLQRDASGTDTDVNADDFDGDGIDPAPTPGAAPEESTPPPPPGEPITIEQLQGTTDVSPYAGQTVTTRGVVTAAYPSGGFYGFYIQTPDTGGAIDFAAHDASDAVFVYQQQGTVTPEVGDYVEVTGDVSEYKGLTELSIADGSAVTTLTDAVPAVKPATVGLPTDQAQRESLEGMLVAPQSTFTVADNYGLNQYGEIGLASGTTPLFTPTDVADPHDADAIKAVEDANAARSVTLDDGASVNYMTNDAAKDTPLPYLTQDHQIRVGSPVTFTAPVIFDYRNGGWDYQPTTQLTGDGDSPATFGHTRTNAPAATGGDLHIASFNVLNYFPTTGEEFEAEGNSCTSYDDRDGNPITVDRCDDPDGPRGAWNQVNFLRQQAKIVHAINHLGADIVSLEEIENSAKFGQDRDAAVKTLVQALNDDSAAGTWAYVPTPSTAGSQADEDVIRTAFIYKPASVQTVGDSVIDDATAFDNARDPLAQGFKPAGAPDYKTFAVVVNHFKSKGSGVDDGTGQGNANPDRVAQAKELVKFAKDVQKTYDTRRVFLSGDLNSYTQEDPMQVLYKAGYTDIGSAKAPGEATYLFDGLVGSLDHVLANRQALDMVTGAHVWNINSVEPVALEYSRYNYNVTDFYNQSPYRASDHDPLVVGLNTDVVTLNLLNINDFHGRIDDNTTKFATTVEQLRQDGGAGNTLFMAAGDNVGASLFASASANDNPTIDVLNALGMNASSVGNHEFDKGFSDLTGHLIPRADWRYLAANVYKKGTTEPALPGHDYKIFTRDGVRVGVVGAITQEAPSLVSPGGIANLDFGDPVTAVNRVADQLTDGDPTNGEADVIVAEFHEGATEGTPDGATFEEELAAGGAFAHIVNDLSPKVSVIFTGHTHKEYAWDAPVPGQPGTTRPIMQTGDYGANVGQVQLTVDNGSGDVLGYTARNVPQVSTADLSLPRVAKVNDIVTAALADAKVKGGVPVAKVTADITTAYQGGSYTGPGKTYVGPNPADPKAGRDDRQSESTIGDLVANALLSSMEPNGAEIGVTNPGGLRDELFYAGVDSTNADGVVTYAEANSVLPFVNNLWTVDLTGAQFKQVLEEQWQPDGSSRPFLNLGLSSNVSVTLDKDAPTGQHVTSVMVDGQPLDMGRTYRIGTFSFLATGGDNFTTFLDGKNVKDTGMIDRDAWIDYLGDHSPVSPTFDRREVYASDLPASIAAGADVSFTLHRLDLTSLGSPANSTVDVTMHSTAGDQTVATDIPVTDGEAAVAFTAPASVPQGATFVVTAHPSGTTVTIPAESGAPSTTASAVSATLSPATSVVRRSTPTLTATVTSDGAPVDGGTVEVWLGADRLGSATVADGTADVVLPKFGSTGTKTLKVAYTGTAGIAASSTTVDARVVRARSTVSAKAPAKVRKKHRWTLRVAVTASNGPVTGKVAVYRGKKVVRRATLTDGKVSVRMPAYRHKGKHTVRVKYLGSPYQRPDSVRVTVRVR